MKNPLVSIVIPTHNRKKKLLRLLDSIEENTYKEVELIVVDDASTDETSTAVKSCVENGKYGFPIQIRTNSEKRYVAESRNTGLQFSTGEFVFLIDDDNVLNRTCIETLVRKISSDDSIGMVGPMMFYLKNKNEIWWAGTKRSMTTSRTKMMGKSLPVPEGDFWETDDFPNAWMIRRSLYKKGVAFDDELVMHYEESDFAYKAARITKCKFLVCRNAITYHDVDHEIISDITRRWADNNRVYFTARNRAVFHRRYSSGFQYLLFIIFWHWLFLVYYICYIFSLPMPLGVKLRSSRNYFLGALSGIFK